MEDDRGGSLMNAAYRRDVLSLLRRPKINECRLISRNFHGAIDIWPVATKPRMKFKSLTLYENKGVQHGEQNVSIVVGRGQVDNLPTREISLETDTRTAPRFKAQVQSLIHFDYCCQELKAQSRHLIGQLVHADMPPDEWVEVKFDSIDESETFSFRTGNRLTAKSAFRLLHFFYHLRHSAFHKLHVDVGSFNLSPFQLLTEHSPWPFSLHTRHLILGAPCGELGEMEAIARFIAFNQLVCSCSADHVDQLAELMAKGGKQVRRMRVQCISLNGDNIDTIVKRLKDDVACLGKAVAETTLELYSHTFPWPTLCEAYDAESVEENEKGEEVLKYHHACVVGADQQQGFGIEIKRLKKLPSVIHLVKIFVDAY